MRSSRRTFLTTAALGALGVSLATGPASAQSNRRAPGAPAAPAPVLAPPHGARINPRDFGAVGDGATKDTRAVQTALDRCAVLGGGEVLLSSGIYLVGAIRIGSNTTLRLDRDATLQGSPDVVDYPVTQVRWEGRFVPGYIGLVWAQDASNVRLEGEGKIVGSPNIHGRVEQATRLRNPALLEFINVRGLSVRGLDTQQNDMWSIHPLYCEDVIFEGVNVKGGADGVDVDSCRRVVIADCTFDTGDDCISLKSGRGMEGATIARASEDVRISGCSFRDAHFACIGIGSETSAGIRRVLVENCHFLSAHSFAVYIKSRPGRGAFIEDIAMRNLDISGVGQGFLRLNFLDSGKQDQFPVAGTDGIPTVRNFRFEHIRVTDAPALVEAVSIHPDKPLDGLTLRDITGTCTRGITLANMRNVTLDHVDVTVAAGPKLSTVNVTGHGLQGAAALTPTVRPPPVEATVPPYQFGAVSGPPN